MKDSLDRHQIMHEPLFWTKIAYTACSWLRGADEKSLRRFWIDDFLPERATNTKHGVDVEGIAWVGVGPGAQHPYRFIASVPQKMLRHRRDNPSIARLILDETRQTLQLEITDENRDA